MNVELKHSPSPLFPQRVDQAYPKILPSLFSKIILGFSILSHQTRGIGDSCFFHRKITHLEGSTTDSVGLCHSDIDNLCFQNPKKLFPIEVSYSSSPGYLSNSLQSSYCRLNKQPSLEKCDRFSKVTLRSLKKQNPDFYKELFLLKINPETKNPLTQEEKLIELPPPFDLIVSIDPDTDFSLKKAYSFAEDFIVKAPIFHQFNQEGLLSIFQKTHGILNSTEQETALRNNNLFETALLLLQDGMTKKAAYLEAQNNPQAIEQLDDFFSFIEKVIHSKNSSEITEEDWELFKKIVPSGIPHEEIVSRMKRFFSLLQEKIQKGEAQHCFNYVVETAAWVHQEIIRISPFSQGNPDLARLWMNIVLQLGGIQAVVFPEEEEYLVAVKKGLKEESKLFASFLKTVISWNQNNLG